MTRTTRLASSALRSCVRHAFLAIFPALLAACGAGDRLGPVGGETGDSGASVPATPIAADGGAGKVTQRSDCKDGTEGCPCTAPDDITSCGVVHFSSGVYKGCDPGESRCLEDMTWGPCIATALPMAGSAVGDKP